MNKDYVTNGEVVVLIAMATACGVCVGILATIAMVTGANGVTEFTSGFLAATVGTFIMLVIFVAIGALHIGRIFYEK